MGPLPRSAFEALVAESRVLQLAADLPAAPVGTASQAWLAEQPWVPGLLGMVVVLVLLTGLASAWMGQLQGRLRTPARARGPEERTGRPDRRERRDRDLTRGARRDGDGAGVGGIPPSPSSPPARPSPGAQPEKPPESADVLDVLRSCMDEVSYTSGTPNVLSMTKYLPGEGGREGGGRARSVVGGEAAGSFSRRDDGDETVLEIEGVLDAVTAPGVREVVEALVAEGRASITVDLSSLRLIDSSGVGVIVGLFKRCRTFGGTVRVAGLGGQPLAVFRLLRLDRIFALP